MESGRRFDPSKYLRTIKTRGGGQETYLPVPARLLWLRADHPNATVVTEALKLDDRAAVFKATITLPNGGTGMGHGSETAGDSPDFIEKAETKAIGRALAALGYGTEFADVQDSSGIADAAELLPAPAPVVALPATVPVSAPAPPAPPQPVQPAPVEPAAPALARPERSARYADEPARAERTDRGERTDRAERADRVERSDRIERGERSDRGDRNDRADRGDRFAPPPPRPLGVDRPARTERADTPIERPPRAERGGSDRYEPVDEPVAPPRPTLVERSLRPERVGRARESAPIAPVAPPTPAEPAEFVEETPPTPIRRTGRTLTGRTLSAAAATAAPVPEPEPPLEPQSMSDASSEGSDELDTATISTTSFWRWARAQGYADRRAVEAVTGRSMDTMTPREAYYRLKETIARGQT